MTGIVVVPIVYHIWTINCLLSWLACIALSHSMIASHQGGGFQVTLILQSSMFESYVDFSIELYLQIVEGN